MSDVTEILKKVLNKICKESEVDSIVKLPNVASNCTAALFKVAVNYHERKILQLFAKVALISPEVRELFRGSYMFQTEQYVYGDLAKVYNDLQEKHNVPEKFRFVFPKCYALHPDFEEETVVIEDLETRDFVMEDIKKATDWETSTSIVSTLARFHALSFAYKNEFSEEFEAATKILTFAVGSGNNAMNNAIKKERQKIINMVVDVTDDVLKDRLKKFLEPSVDEGFRTGYKSFGTTVFVHGDYKTGNLMLRRQNGVIETIAVDYQTVHAGCPITDLLYFIFMGTDEEFRRQYYHKLLDHYFNELTLALKRLQIDVNDVYPRETFDNELKEMLPHALRMSVVILPIVTVDAESAPQVAGDADIKSFAIKPNELFAKRFNGIVRDCAKWGVI